MNGKNQRKFIFSGQRVQGFHQLGQVDGIIHVLLAVNADRKIAARLETQALMNDRSVNRGAMIIQNFLHGRSGFHDPVRRQTFRQEVTAAVLGIAKVDVTDMVHNVTVDFFRHAHVKTPVASLHVKHGYLPPFGGNDRQATVRVAQHQHRLRLFLLQHRVGLDDGFADGFGGIPARRVQVMFWPRHAEFLEKDSVQFVIVILTGVDQHMMGDFFQDGDYARQSDDLRPRADDGHDLDF